MDSTPPQGANSDESPIHHPSIIAICQGLVQKEAGDPVLSSEIPLEAAPFGGGGEGCLHWVFIAACTFFAAAHRLSLVVIVQFSHSDVSDSLQPHGLQHARFPCSCSGACSNSCPLSQ